MTPTPHLPPEDADVFSVENLRQGLKGCEAVYPFDQDRAYEGLRRWANLAADEIDRLAKRVQEAEREPDELRAWKTATHEQWAAWTRDDFKARAEAAERERDEARLPSVEEVQDVFEKARLREALAAAEAREAATQRMFAAVVYAMPGSEITVWPVHMEADLGIERYDDPVNQCTRFRAALATAANPEASE